LHALTQAIVEFDVYGKVVTNVKTYSIRLDPFQTVEDFVNLIAAAFYIFLFVNIFMSFVHSMKHKFFDYKKW
jgi:hypothetical protein